MALSYFFAPVMPNARGASGRPAGGTFRTDAITLLLVPATTAQHHRRPDAGELGRVEGDRRSQLPAKRRPAVRVQGGHVDSDLRRKRLVRPVHDHRGPERGAAPAAQSRWLGKAYDAGAKVVQIRSHTYYLKTDVATKTYQLMHYDGADGDVPVVDNVVGLEFDYSAIRNRQSRLGSHSSTRSDHGPLTDRSQPTPRGFG